MKILFASNYIYDKRFREYAKENTGYGFMVADILQEVSKHEDTYLYTHTLTKGIDSDYRVFQHKKRDILLNARIKDIISGLKIAKNSKVSRWKTIRYIFCFLDKGCFVKQLKKIQPDIVHIHGGTLEIKPYIDACQEQGIPFLITFHGLNYNVDKIPTCEKKYEVELLNLCSKHGFPVSVVSSGLKEIISKRFKLTTDNIRIILNGTRLHKINSTKRKNHDSNQLYNILCIGNISLHKNQIMLLNSLEKLPEDFKRKIRVKFCGKYMDGPHIDEEIERLNLAAYAEYLGSVERDRMEELWKEADLNVVVSTSEGFGLSIIEGFAHGVPTLTFEDLPAVKDLYSSKSMILIRERTEDAVAKGIVRCSETLWSQENIRKWSEQFSIEEIVEKYIMYYHDIMKHCDDVDMYKK